MKGRKLVNDTGVEGMLQTSSEEGTSVTSLRGAGEGFTREVASALVFVSFKGLLYTGGCICEQIQFKLFLRLPSIIFHQELGNR